MPVPDRPAFWDNDWWQLGISLSLLFGLGVALRSETAIEVFSLGASAVYVAFYFGALARLWRDEREQARIRSVAGFPRQRWRSWIATGLLVVGVLAIVAFRGTGAMG
jgi:hypothetical protein